ncbi:MAG: translation initiation factor IF-2 [Candidatus Taylorbacteria bacterium]|nr:translation initiation factor IF-2 [Candidatus Taylorbacteria bacterium]
MPNTPKQSRIERPPIVVVMGHIDHGKSTLLDYIRKTHIVDGEAGGITQHVGAYEAIHTSADGKEHKITFLDTPGHEAFCGIRERGAKAADIAILIVSAEDGVKPQTVEAYKNIMAEKMPYVVAITKIDKPNANIERTKQSLGENEIYVEGWGGDIPCVAISSLNGTGIPELLDMVILVAELEGLTADATIPAHGMVIESERDSRKGISATILIKDGILNIGTFVVAGTAYAPVRFIEDFKGQKIETATASRPVRINGWNEIPECGVSFVVVERKKEAEKMIEKARSDRQTKHGADISNIVQKVKGAPKEEAADAVSHLSEQTDKDRVVIIPLIIKADFIGSLEGIDHELKKITHDKVKLEIISESIGDINENDVKTAMSDPNVIIVGFNANPDKKAASLIERSPVNVKTFSIIYELSEFIRETLASKVPKEFIEEIMGRAKILAVFSKEKDRQVVGGKVETGVLKSGNDVRIMRRDVELCRGKIRELQEKKLRVQEVAEGHEFGIMVEAKIEIAVGDRIEAVRTVEKV